MPGTPPPLADWESFYVVVGSSAGALTGLMFVVVALTRDFRTEAVARGMRTFATPTIVHFTTVLSLAAVLSMPKLTRAELAAILLTVAILALAYVLYIFRNSRRLVEYEPDLEDIVWHLCFPTVAHASILLAGVIAWSAPSTSLYMVGGSMLALLIVGIHNAWDSAVWMVVRSARPEGG